MSLQPSISSLCFSPLFCWCRCRAGTPGGLPVPAPWQLCGRAAHACCRTDCALRDGQQCWALPPSTNLQRQSLDRLRKAPSERSEMPKHPCLHLALPFPGSELLPRCLLLALDYFWPLCILPPVSFPAGGGQQPEHAGHAAAAEQPGRGRGAAGRPAVRRHAAPAQAPQDAVPGWHREVGGCHQALAATRALAAVVPQWVDGREAWERAKLG